MTTKRDWSNGRILLPNTGDVAFAVAVAGDAHNRWELDADGTVKSGDGTLAPTEQSGTSVVTDRCRYNGTVGGVTTGNFVEWDPTKHDNHGRDLLDFTDPTIPEALVAGIYAVAVWGQHAGGAAGKFWRFDLELDGAGDDATFETSGSLNVIGAQHPTLTVNGIWYTPLGGQLYCGIDHDAGGSIGSFKLYVQLLAEA